MPGISNTLIGFADDMGFVPSLNDHLLIFPVPLFVKFTINGTGPPIVLGEIDAICSPEYLLITDSNVFLSFTPILTEFEFSFTAGDSVFSFLETGSEELLFDKKFLISFTATGFGDATVVFGE